jgi:hypothetical protein
MRKPELAVECCVFGMVGCELLKQGKRYRELFAANGFPGLRLELIEGLFRYQHLIQSLVFGDRYLALHQHEIIKLGL